jgi:hypothetical protein
MNTYKILASYTVYCHLIVEADNINEARQMAYDADGGDFSSSENGDWNIDDVITLEKAAA